MKKHLLAVGLMLACHSLLAQKIKEKDIQKALEVYKEYSVPHRDSFPFYEFIDSSHTGKTKSDVHKAAHATLAEIFRDSKAVIEFNDVEQGLIIGRGRSKIAFAWSLVQQQIYIPFNIEVRSRDGKYRVQLKDITRYEGVSQTVPVDGETSIIHAASRFPGDFTRKFWTAFAADFNSFEQQFKQLMAKKLNQKDEF